MHQERKQLKERIGGTSILRYKMHTLLAENGLELIAKIYGSK